MLSKLRGRPWVSSSERESGPHSVIVTYHQSGGFAGLFRGCELDSASLPAEEAAQLETLVKQSNLSSQRGGRSTQARDTFSHQITVKSEDGLYEITFDDLNAPESVYPLLEFLQARMKPRTPK